MQKIKVTVADGGGNAIGEICTWLTLQCKKFQYCMSVNHKIQNNIINDHLDNEDLKNIHIVQNEKKN